MDDATFAFWQEYVREIADLFDLKDWDVILSRQNPESESAWASNYTYYGQRRCDIHLHADNFFVEPPENQRRIVIHELLHCHTDNVFEASRIYLSGKEGDEASLFERYFKQQSEWMVDSLATAIAKHFPLPERNN